MKRIKRFFAWIDRITAWMAVLALVLTFAFVFLNVLTRYIFGTGFAWSEEGARYALMAVIILGVLEVTHLREHFCVDLLTNGAPKKLLRVMKATQDFIMIGIMAVLSYGSWEMTVLNWQNKTPAIGMPSWIPYGLMLVSCAVSVCYLIGHLLEDLGFMKAGDDEEGGASVC